MKQMLKIALIATVATGMVAPALAQDNFPDVAENHWAFEALENLKREGIIVGYPDGRYRGTRFMTRYEAAVAINAAYRKMMSMYSGLNDQIEALRGQIKNGGNGGGDNGDAMKMLDDMQKSLNGMKAWGDDIANLKKMAGTFERELASLGVDVEALKKDLDELKGKMGMGGSGVAISGDANLVVYAGNSRDNNLGMTKDGHIVGANEKNGLAPVGLTKDMNIYHEVGVGLSGGNDKVTWNANLAIGNLLPGIGSQSVRTAGPFFSNVNTDVYINDLAVKFNDSLFGLGFGAEVGRVGVKVGPYLFQRNDTTPYSSIDRWDDGKFRMDGAVVGFNFGGAKVTVLGGKNSDLNSTNGTDFSMIPFAGGAKVDATLGAVLDLGIGENGNLRGAYLMHDTDSNLGVNQPNRLNVYGVEGNYKLSNIKLHGGYSKSVLTRNADDLGLDSLNQAAFANASYDGGNWALTGEYRKVQNDFRAAGGWRRIGTNWSPKNIETVTGMLSFNLSDRITLGYTGEFGQTIETRNGIAGDTDIQSHYAKLGYKVNDSWSANFGYEDVKVETNPTNIRQKWASVGFGYNMGKNTKFNFAYEYGSVTNPVAWGTGAAGTYRGGFFSSQLSIKF